MRHVQPAPRRGGACRQFVEQHQQLQVDERAHQDRRTLVNGVDVIVHEIRAPQQLSEMRYASVEALGLRQLHRAQRPDRPDG